MFWTEREREPKDQNGGPPCGQVRVLVFGHSESLEALQIALMGSEQHFFVELWDVSGVIFIHDLSQRRTKASLQKWAAEVAATGTLSAPLGSSRPGSLPVPYIVISNKADIAAKEGMRISSGNLIDVAGQWVEKQGLFPSSEELPLTESFPSSWSLLLSAKEVSLSNGKYEYNMLPPLPAQRNVILPATLYAQQPMTDLENHVSPRFSSFGGSPEISSSS